MAWSTLSNKGFHDRLGLQENSSYDAAVSGETIRLYATIFSGLEDQPFLDEFRQPVRYGVAAADRLIEILLPTSRIVMDVQQDVYAVAFAEHPVQIGSLDTGLVGAEYRHIDAEWAGPGP